MIDRPARDVMAQLVRQFAAGTIENEDYFEDAERVAEATRDQGVKAIFESTISLAEDDFAADRNRDGDRLSYDKRRELAIATMFLHNDLEYAWPENSGFSSWCDFVLMWLGGIVVSVGLVVVAVYPLLTVFCFTLAVPIYLVSRWAVQEQRQRHLEWLKEVGDIDVWPFLHRSDFNKARQNPVLLRGKRRAWAR